jgi:hypothetical protein
MKKIYILFFTLCVLFLHSQAPQFINYQGLARNSAGVPIPNSPLSLTLSIINPSVVYAETHGVTTNSLGLFSLKIGNGNQISPVSFSLINWGSGSYSLEVIANAGTGPVNLGSQQLVSVPYALYAAKAGNAVTYSASPNISISSSNSIDLTDVISAPGPYGNLGITQSKVPFFTVDQKGRLVMAGEYTANVLGDIQGRLDSQMVKKLNGVPIASVNPTNGQVLQFNGTDWTPANIATGGVTTINTTGGIGGGPITSVGTVSLLPSGVAPGVYGAAPNSIPSFSVDNFGRITSASSYLLAPPVTSTYIAGQNIFISSSGTVNTISSPSYSINFPSSSAILLTNGNFTSTATIPQPTLSGGTGISIAGTGPTYTISSAATGLNAPWLIGGNSGTSPGTHYLGTNDNQSLFFKTNNTQVASMTTSGRMGIGLSVPFSTLSVFGNLSVGTNYGSFTAPPNSAIFEGSIGIGTGLPTSALHIEGSNASTNFNAFSGSPETHIRINNLNQTNNNFSSIAFSTLLSNSASSEMAKIVGQNVNHTAGSVAGDLIFMTRNTANINEIVRITSAGNVGIGTSLPTQKLDVVGSVQIPATSEYLYGAAKTKYHSIPSVDFVPENSTIYATNLIAGHIYIVPAGGTVNITPGFSSNFEAPLNLPDGATITALDAYVVDDDATYNVSYVQLWRVNSPTGVTFGTASNLATAGPTSGASPNIQLISDVSIATPVVDNQNFYYYVRFGAGFPGTGAVAQNIRLARVLITYVVNKTD